MKFTAKFNFQYNHGGKKCYTPFQSEFMDYKEMIDFLSSLKKINIIRNVELFNERGAQYSEKELMRYEKEMKTEPHHFILYWDGSYDLDTKQGGMGIVVYFEEKGVYKRERYGFTVDFAASNNVMEYIALEKGLQLVLEKEIGPQQITARGDSKLVVNQLKGEWPCYEQEFSIILDRIEAMLEKRGMSLQIEHIHRNDNDEAHKLARKALEGTETNSITEIEGDVFERKKKGHS